MTDRFVTTMPPPDTLIPEKRAQILAGARIVFTRDGYDGASMTHIAAAAGVSKGTLYNYFANKEALFVGFVTEECATRIAQLFHDQDHASDPERYLTRLGTRFVQLIISPAALEMHRLVVAEALKFPKLGHAFYDAGPRQTVKRLSAALLKMDQKKILKIAQPEEAAELFLALCQGRMFMKRTLFVIDQPSEAEIDQAIRLAVQVFLSYYGTLRDHAARDVLAPSRLEN